MNEVTKLKRYMNDKPKLCIHCLINGALGQTDWGVLGCRFCQKIVDDYMKANFIIREQA